VTGVQTWCSSDLRVDRRLREGVEAAIALLDVQTAGLPLRTTEIYTLSLHDALPICDGLRCRINRLRGEFLRNI